MLPAVYHNSGKLTFQGCTRFILCCIQRADLRAADGATEAKEIHRQFYLARSPVGQLPPTARPLRSASCVCSDPGHIFDTAAAFRVPTRIIDGNYHLESAVPDKWILSWFDHGLGANKTELGLKHCWSTHVRIRMIGNPRTLSVTDGSYR